MSLGHADGEAWLRFGKDGFRQESLKDMVGFGVFGAGEIGGIHAGHINSHPGANLISICDPNVGRASSLANEFGAKVARSPEEMIADREVDAAVIAASTIAHRELARLCLMHGKPFLCEKPVDLSLDSAIETLRLARKSGVVAGMGFNRRYDFQHSILKDAVAEGEIGRIEMMHFTSRTHALPNLDYIKNSGGMLRDKGAHFFDLACWIAGERPVEVYAVGDCLIEPRFAKHGDVDTAMVVLRMESGALCHFNFSRRTNYGYDESIEVFGSEGKMESRPPVPLNLVRSSGEHVHSEGIHGHWVPRFVESYFEQLDAFIQRLEGPVLTFPMLADGVVAEAIADAGIRSMKEARSVRLDLDF